MVEVLSTRATPNRRAGVQSVGRAIALLRSFSRETLELGVNELARAHRLHPSSVSRLLATLAEAGFVRLNPATGRYRLGFAALEIAGLVLLQLDFRAVAQPVMREIAKRGEETANLAVLDGNEAVIVEQAPSPRPFSMVSWVGRRIPLHATAHGKVLLTFNPSARSEAVIAALADAQGRLPAVTQTTLTSVTALRQALALTAERGYAVAFGELTPDGAAVAAPVFDHTGAVAASLSLSGPLFRYDAAHVAELAALVVAGTRRISAELGWRGGEGPLSPGSAPQSIQGVTP